MEFRKLKPEEINARVQQCFKDGCIILLYKDARCDMNILDETLGSDNWQRDHKEIKGNVYCGVSIWDDKKKQWITKWDCGSESFADAEKGEASDSFKRACFNVGIGRELYTSPFIYINLNSTEVTTKKKNDGKEFYELEKKVHFSVKEIQYDGNQISKLVILDNKGKERFNWSLKEKYSIASTNQAKAPLKEEYIKKIENYGGTLEQVRVLFKLDSIEDLTNEMLEKIIAKKEGKQ